MPFLVYEDSKSPLPLQLLQIYAVETIKDRQRRVDSQGKLYFDNLRFVYVNDVDYAGPVYSDPVPLSSSVYQDSLHFSVHIVDDQSGVDIDTIQMVTEYALFVYLNTAINQSISVSDATT